MASGRVKSTRIALPVFLVVLLTCFGYVRSLSCFKCGEYNDGVGSITPCINYTANKNLHECKASAKHCIKYVSEGSTVRDCVETCVEKEAWSTRTYCCSEDGCNGAQSQFLSSKVLWLVLSFIFMTAIGQRMHV